MNKREQPYIYMDFASATPISHEVYAAMEPYVTDLFYNPSALYSQSLKIQQIIEKTRKNIAKILNTQSSNIYFTDGATEANNIAITGTINSWKLNHPHETPHIITTTIEHASVLSVYKHFESQGVLVDYLDVDSKGRINPKQLKELLQKNTILVSIGYVNGEIGVIQDIKALVKIVRHFRKNNHTAYPYVHSDAVQAVNVLPEIGLPQLGIDMLVINAAKIYGPKKIAVLAMNAGIQIEPIIFGGNQERGLRAGTENTSHIIAMGAALSKAREMQKLEFLRLQKINIEFVRSLQETFPQVSINSHHEGAPHIVNISFPNLSHEEIMLRLDSNGVMCSVKSACKAGEEGDSHVILSLRKNTSEPTGSLRFSFGRTTELEDIKIVVKILTAIINDMEKTYQDYYS